MASRYEQGTTGNTAAQTPYTKTTTTLPSQEVSRIGETAGSMGSTWENIDTQNMTPEAMASLEALIQALQGGGTPEQRAEKAQRDQANAIVQQLLGTVTTEAAMSDSAKLMQLNLQQSMEKNMPAISRAIEGAGTSASSMQGLLSQQLARDASLAAGALGAQQAASYAQQRTGLAGVLEALTRPTSESTNALLKALDISRGAVTSTQKSGGSSSSSTATRNTITNKGETSSTDTYTPLTGVAAEGTETPAFGTTLDYTPLDPNRYYSELGRSGGNLSLYDYLKGI